MLQLATNVDWVEVDTEVEAFFLEYNLIKQHQPRFNIRLKDDKSYPWLAVTVNEPWPRPQVMRGKKRAGVQYFGPYAHAYAIRETLDLLLRTFPVRTCTNAKFDRHQKDGRPCLLAHIEKCAAPCVGNVSEEDYAGYVTGLMQFLAGDHEATLNELHMRMHDAASEHRFESAARIRDQIAAVRRVSERQAMVAARGAAFDVLALAADDLEAQVQILHIRRGRVVGNDGFGLERGVEATDADLVERAIAEMVLRSQEIPAQILVNMLPSDVEAVEAVLRTQRGKPVSILASPRGDRRALLSLAVTNAQERLVRTKLRRASDPNARAQALHSLQSALELRRAPLRIECYDISHLGGTNIVASMVVMEDGLLRKSEYRRFRITGLDNQDDYASMEQVLTRRLQRQTEAAAASPIKKGQRFAYPPDLLVIDGGKGQLHAAMNAVTASGVDVEVVSLAKRLEELYRPGNPDPIQLERNDPALYLLQQLRDEAHRFAITYQRQQRGTTNRQSILDGIPGLGPKRATRLIREFGSAKALRALSRDELLAVSWLPNEVAAQVFDKLHPDLRR